MADITMCLGQMCAKKETCYRFTATPNEHRQSYFVAPPISMLTGECEMFIEDKDGNNQ